MAVRKISLELDKRKFDNRIARFNLLLRWVALNAYRGQGRGKKGEEGGRRRESKEGEEGLSNLYVCFRTLMDSDIKEDEEKEEDEEEIDKEEKE